jgi:hypothetical protein
MQLLSSEKSMLDNNDTSDRIEIGSVMRPFTR